MTEETTKVQSPNHDPVTGRFLPGHTAAKAKKGKRHKLQQMQLDYLQELAEKGVPHWKACAQLARDESLPAETRHKFYKMEDEFLNGKSSILTGDDDESYTGDELKQSILILLNKGSSIRVENQKEGDEEGD